MADSASESDSNSIDGMSSLGMMPPSPQTREQLQKRIESLQQQNRVLKFEMDTYRLRIKALQEENRNLRQNSVSIVRILLLSLRLLKKVTLCPKKVNLTLQSEILFKHFFIITKYLILLIIFFKIYFWM